MPYTELSITHTLLHNEQLCSILPTSPFENADIDDRWVDLLKVTDLSHSKVTHWSSLLPRSLKVCGS